MESRAVPALSQKPGAVFLLHRLILRMGVIAFADVDFVACWGTANSTAFIDLHLHPAYDTSTP
jgi:hypothetical protein